MDAADYIMALINAGAKKSVIETNIRAKLEEARQDGYDAYAEELLG